MVFRPRFIYMYVYVYMYIYECIYVYMQLKQAQMHRSEYIYIQGVRGDEMAYMKPDENNLL